MHKYFQKVLAKEVTMVTNPIRLNWHYVIWYRTFIVATVSLIVPFSLLAYWNFNTLAVMIRRRRLRNRPERVFRCSLLDCNGRCRDVTNSNNSTDIQCRAVSPRIMTAVTINMDSLTPQTSLNSSSDEGNIFYERLHIKLLL